MISSKSRLLIVAAPAGALALMVGLTGCSSSSGATPAAPSSAASRSGSAPTGPSGFVGARAAADGKIAAISGKTLQVQSSTDQTAVDYTGKTSFSQLRRTTLAAVKVGSCIFASSAPTTAGKTAPTAITATSVRIVSTSGTCTGAGSRNGARPGGVRPSGAPSGFPTGVRSGGPDRSGGFGGAVIGKVTAVSRSAVKVSARTFTRASSASSAPAATTRTVKVTAKTTYLISAKASSADLEVGLCAVVQGPASSTGAVTARSIALSPQTSGACTRGQFGGRFGGGGGTGG